MALSPAARREARAREIKQMLRDGALHDDDFRALLLENVDEAIGRLPAVGRARIPNKVEFKVFVENERTVAVVLPGRTDTDGQRMLAETPLGESLAKPAFRRLLKRDPKRALSRALGVELPTNLKIKVLQESASLKYVVLPADLAHLKPPHIGNDVLVYHASAWCGRTCGDTCILTEWKWPWERTNDETLECRLENSRDPSLCPIDPDEPMPF